MSNLKYRISKIVIQNIKNTEYGEIVFPDNDKLDERRAGVLGLYGANGSGKTAVIYTLNILKTLMSGKALSRDTYDYITKGEKEAKLKFDFNFDTDDLKAFISYEFKITKVDDEVIFVSDEKVMYKREDDVRPLVLIDTTNASLKDVLFFPKMKYDYIKKDQDKLIDLIVSSKMAKDKRESFIFRQETLSLLETIWERPIEYHILKLLNNYAKYNMFIVLDKKDNYLPFLFGLSEDKQITKSGNLGLLYGISELSDDEYTSYQKVINSLSLILSEIIPGIELIIKNYGKVTLSDGAIINRVELMSKSKALEIPLKYESEGIKKIISILSALTAMFNNDGVLVAIDELDSGVFEYLLGTLLEVINDTGSGQLIFTSHNLHPLELLNSENIIFTTTNPKNRYIKFTNVRETNNLRNFYLREVALRATGQKEVVYNDIKKHKISSAFRKAKMMTK